MKNYATLSLETHLFFSRIMKEHSLFLEAGFPCKNHTWVQKADWFRKQFESLLLETLRISAGNMQSCILNSNELVTEFTIPAEKRTQYLSGIPINYRISIMEKNLQAGCSLTEMSLAETLKYREFKTAGAEGILENEIASIILPLLADHVLREANHYIRILECSTHERGIRNGTV